MSRLEELIAALCPDGVEYKTLGEICSRQKGMAITAGKMKELDTPDGAVRIFAGGNTTANVNYNDIPDKSIITTPSVIVKSRGNIGFEYYDRHFTHKNELWSYSSNNKTINIKFIYYFLDKNINKFQNKAKTGKLPQISTQDTDNYKVPVPPLPIQEEVVQILDKFTELTAELTVELEKRKQQYKYYKSHLFNNNCNVEYTPLKNLAINYDAKRRPIEKSKRDKGIYPYYGASGIIDYVKDYIFDGDYLLISEDGANLLARNTPVAFSITGKTWVNNHAHILKFSNLTLQKYVEFYINFSDLTKYISTAAQPKLTQENLNNIMIPKPSFETIRCLVSILDRFDALCNDPISGLPAEIEARKKQYEYYRDKLLTFKEKEAD